MFLYYFQLAIERVIMPQIKQKVVKFIESPDEDQWLYQQCMKYADISLDHLGYVKHTTQILFNYTYVCIHLKDSQTTMLFFCVHMYLIKMLIIDFLVFQSDYKVTN